MSEKPNVSLPIPCNFARVALELMCVAYRFLNRPENKNSSSALKKPNGAHIQHKFAYSRAFAVWIFFL